MHLVVGARGFLAQQYLQINCPMLYSNTFLKEFKALFPLQEKT
jgi:hypothetical protein